MQSARDTEYKLLVPQAQLGEAWQSLARKSTPYGVLPGYSSVDLTSPVHLTYASSLALGSQVN